MRLLEENVFMNRTDSGVRSGQRKQILYLKYSTDSQIKYSLSFFWVGYLLHDITKVWLLKLSSYS